ncbi:MAG TPA: hypothetical protein PLD82_09595 [Spirochaetota bacterium]|nr:hypothetical protein [Spirochaetota bacterium]HPH02285.1 hypothetical protein [Spirochaetota bacterium]
MQVQDISSRMPAQPSGAVNAQPPPAPEQAPPPPPPPEQTTPAPSDNGQRVDVKA